jgi:hypothetical protein
VKLVSSAKKTLISAFEDGAIARTVVAEGTLRAADLDLAKFKLKTADRSSVTFYVTENELAEQATRLLGERVKVTGSEYPYQNRHILIAEELTSLEPDASDGGDDDESDDD